MRLIAAVLVFVLPAWAQTAVFPDAIADLGDLWRAINGNPVATLNSAIDDSVQTFTVTAQPGFVSNMGVVIDSEIIFCATYSAGTFSGCTRGVDGSSAAAHALGASVAARLLAWHVNALAVEVIAIESFLGTNPSAGSFSYYAPRSFASQTVATNSVADTTLIDVTEAGMLIGVGCQVGAATLTGTLTANIEITIDNNTETVIPIYGPSAVTQNRAARAVAISAFPATETTVDSKITLAFLTKYKSSLVVTINIAEATSSASTLICSAMRAPKT